jgi:hypothetical protein
MAIPDWVTNLEVMWEEPAIARFFTRLGSIGRLICYDKRGTGISDPVPLGALPTRASEGDGRASQAYLRCPRPPFESRRAR